MEISVENGKAFRALLTDLLKYFDYPDHELLIAKLKPYRFSLLELKLVNDYLSNRKQRKKINSSHSSLQEIISEVPESSILEPLLFIISLIDLFFIIEDFDIARYADENTPCLTVNNMDGIVKSLVEASTKSCKWFSDILMKSNTDKFRMLVSTNSTVSIKV